MCLMFLQHAVLGIGMSEMLVIFALGILVYGAQTIAEAPAILAAVVRGIHKELNAYHEDKQLRPEQPGDVEAENR